MSRRGSSQSGQVMVLVAVSLIALIGSAALVLLAGSAEWQKNQLQEVADQAALEAALNIGIGCNAAEAKVVIDAAVASIGKQRTAVRGIRRPHGEARVRPATTACKLLPTARSAHRSTTHTGRTSSRSR